MKKDELQGLLAKKRELVEITKNLDTYSLQLLEDKRKLVDQIDELIEKSVKPLKEEIAGIDAEIELVLKETGQDKLVSDNYGAYITEQMTVSITDRAKAWAWLQKHPECLKKDIVKSTELNKLVVEGVVPDPAKDGIDTSGTFTRVNYRRK